MDWRSVFCHPCFKCIMQISSFSNHISKKCTSYKETEGQNIFISLEIIKHIGQDDKANDNYNKKEQ